MSYVERDTNGKVKGVFKWPNPKATEALPDSHQDIKDFNKPKPVKLDIMNDMKDAEKKKLIDFLETNQILTPIRANEFRS